MDTKVRVLMLDQEYAEIIEECHALQRLEEWDTLFDLLAMYEYKLPDSSIIQQRLSMAFTLSGQPDKGLVHADKAIEFFDEHPMSWYMRARALADMKRPVEAFESIVRCNDLCFYVTDDLWVRLVIIGHDAVYSPEFGALADKQNFFRNVAGICEKGCETILGKGDEHPETPRILMLRSAISSVGHEVGVEVDLDRSLRDLERVQRLESPFKESAIRLGDVLREERQSEARSAALNSLELASREWAKRFRVGQTHAIPEFTDVVLLLKDANAALEQEGLALEAKYESIWVKSGFAASVRFKYAQHLWRMGEFYMAAVSTQLLGTTAKELEEEDLTPQQLEVVRPLHRKMPALADKTCHYFVKAFEMKPHAQSAWGLADLFLSQGFRATAAHWYRAALEVAIASEQVTVQETMEVSLEELGLDLLDRFVPKVPDPLRGSWFPNRDTPGLQLNFQG